MCGPWVANKRVKFPKMCKLVEDSNLHQLVSEFDPSKMKSERVQKIINDMICLVECREVARTRVALIGVVRDHDRGKRE